MSAKQAATNTKVNTVENENPDYAVDLDEANDLVASADYASLMDNFDVYEVMHVGLLKLVASKFGVNIFTGRDGRVATFWFNTKEEAQTFAALAKGSNEGSGR